MSTFWQHIWKLVGTKTLMSTDFHPQIGGQTKIVHRTLAQILRDLLLNEQPQLWAEKLPQWHQVALKFSVRHCQKPATQP